MNDISDDRRARFQRIFASDTLTDDDRVFMRDTILHVIDNPCSPLLRRVVDSAHDLCATPMQRLADGTLTAASAKQAVTDAMEEFVDETAWLAANDPMQWRKDRLAHLEAMYKRFRSLVDRRGGS
jgi:hypothetical protein